MMFDLPDELSAFLDILEKIRPLLKTYKVDEQLSVMRTEGSTVVYRTVW